MYNFVVFSLSRWNIEYGCNIKDICLELSKNHRVLYVDVPLKRKERWFKRESSQVKEVHDRNARNQEPVLIKDNLWHFISDAVLEPVNSIKNNYLFDLLNNLNNKRFSKTIKKAVETIGLEDYILLNDNDIYNGLLLKGLLLPSLYVYYLRDRLPAMSYWKKQTSRLEPMVIKSADLVLTNSVYLAEYSNAYNVNSFYVGQGCDVSHFLERSQNPEPDDLRSIKRPIIGYIGALNHERLDINLVLDVANVMTEYSFVMIGKEDNAFQESALHQLPNVHFLGLKPFEILPTYAQLFDVAFNPQISNEITIGNYPRKIDEYLATGKPIVATDTHAMQVFKEHTYLGQSAEDFKELIELALHEDSPTKSKSRKLFAMQHTWEASVKLMVEYIDQYYGKK